jgi:hypothetical protein
MRSAAFISATWGGFFGGIFSLKNEIPPENVTQGFGVFRGSRQSRLPKKYTVNACV